MRTRRTDEKVQWNWVAIISYSASLVASVVIWKGVFRAVELLSK